MKIALVIPIYQPTEFVLPFLSKFKLGDFDSLVVVDDGSGEAYDECFEQIRELGLFSLIRLKKNKGKGKAMKAALRYLKGKIPDLGGIVTADGDGQHSYQDVLKIRDALFSHPDSTILGVRRRDEMPLHSQSGSKWSSRYFKIMTGVNIEDTQTGLRGIPACRFSSFLASPGSRYEFEMGFLAGISREEKVVEVPIETIYLNDNASTHFRIVRDSLRIAYFPLMYLFSGVLLCFFDVLSYFFIAKYCFQNDGFGQFLAGFCASAVSFFLYEIFTHCLVFFVKPRFKKVVVDFFAFAFLSLAAFGIAFGLECAGMDALPSRILSDLILFLPLFCFTPFLPSGVRPCHFLNR